MKDSWRAERASARWALDGGLKDESRMKRVLGEGGLILDGLTVRTTLKAELEAWNDLSVFSSCGNRARVVLLEVFIGEDVIVFL